MTAFILGIVISLLLIWAMRHFTGFTSQKPDEYVGNLPTFDMHRHLSGELLCEGMIFGPTGRVTSRFRATMKMQWVAGRAVYHALWGLVSTPYESASDGFAFPPRVRKT